MPPICSSGSSWRGIAGPLTFAWLSDAVATPGCWPASAEPSASPSDPPAHHRHGASCGFGGIGKIIGPLGLAVSLGAAE
jgi:hypothetical protein